MVFKLFFYCVTVQLKNSKATLLAVLKAFPPSCPNSGRYPIGTYSTDSISVTVPLVVAPHKVAMDIFFCADDHLLKSLY